MISFFRDYIQMLNPTSIIGLNKILPVAGFLKRKSFIWSRVNEGCVFICCVEVVVVANQNRLIVYLANQSNGNGRPFQNLHNLNQRNVLTLTKNKFCQKSVTSTDEKYFSVSA